MSRDAHIPLALWICAAIVAHMAGGGGAVEVAQVIEDRAQLRQMVQAVRQGLRPGDMTFEVLTDGLAATPPPAPLAPPERPSDAPAEGEPDKETPPDPQQKPDPPKVAQTPPPRPEPPREKAPPPPPPEPPKEEVVKVVPVKPVPPPPLPPADRRIAIRQHVEKDQEDNPEASRIADDANKVAEETMAQIRSKDQDDAAPTPGTPSGPMGPKDKVGDSDHDHSGHSEERAGNEKHAPGERKPESESAEHHSPASPAQAAQAARVAPPPSVPGATGGGRVAQAPPAAVPPPDKGAAGGAGPASPEVIDSPHGGYSLNPANPGGDGKSRVAGKKATPQPYQSPVRVGSIGLGAPGLPGGPNLNLNMAGVQAAVGNEKLKAERAADGASRKSAHRGSWETTDKWKKWRAAIENYDPSVKPGNQTSLNAARVPFATYINMIHNRLHPIFAEEFLASLESLPSGHAFNQNRVTHLEIVLNKDSGSVVRLGVTRPSGMTAFDIVALSSVHRASPFGKAPDAIVSPDGNVYLHWEFHRDPYDACSTRNAKPFLLKAPSDATPVEPPPVRRPPRPVPGDEKRMPSSGPLLPLRR